MSLGLGVCGNFETLYEIFPLHHRKLYCQLFSHVQYVDYVSGFH